MVLGLPFLHDLLCGAWLAVLGRLISRNGFLLGVPPVEVLLHLRKILLRRRNQPTCPQRRLPLLLAGEIVRERRRVLDAGQGGRLELARGGGFEPARKLLEQPRVPLPIRRGVAGRKALLSATAPLDRQPVLVRTGGIRSRPFPRTSWAGEVEAVSRRGIGVCARTWRVRWAVWAAREVSSLPAYESACSSPHYRVLDDATASN